MDATCGLAIAVPCGVPARATSLLDAEKYFRRIKGFASMPQLIDALNTAVAADEKIA